MNIQFVFTKISRPEREIKLYEVLSEFSGPVLPLLCNSTSKSVMSCDGILKSFSQMKVQLLLNFVRVHRHYRVKRLWKEFPTFNWSLRGLNTVMGSN